MAKEWILNSATNRFQLNFKINVGAVSEEIRKCSPKNVGDWQKYYFQNVRTKDHIINLGKKLYIKITEVISSEVNEITEEDCINYILNLVINRTFDGYETERITIYEQLQKILGVNIEPAPDSWDRGFNVDFFIKIRDKYIGLQIKPTGYEYIPQIINERAQQKNTHDKFTKKYGGRVFYIFSITKDKKKIIANPEVIQEIQDEIEKLQKK